MVGVRSRDATTVHGADVRIRIDGVSKLDARQWVHIGAAGRLWCRRDVVAIYIVDHQISGVRGLRCLDAQPGLQMELGAKIEPESTLRIPKFNSDRPKMEAIAPNRQPTWDRELAAQR